MVFVSEYQLNAMFGVLRRDIGVILKELCRRFEVELMEGHVMADHVHMCLRTGPKFTVAHTTGKPKKKSAIMIHQKYAWKRNFVGPNVSSRAYCVGTVGLNEAMIRNYLRTQDEREKKDEQMNLEIQPEGTCRPLTGGFLKLPALRVLLDFERPTMGAAPARS